MSPPVKSYQPTTVELLEIDYLLQVDNRIRKGALRFREAGTTEFLAHVQPAIPPLVLVSNVDDHLRNHGFLYDAGKRGWRLSPAYDLNPVPVDLKPRILSLMIDDRDNSASFDLTVEVGDYFGLVEDDMRAVVTDLVNSISTWRDEAGISAEEINRMATAFDHDEIIRAQKFCAA